MPLNRNGVSRSAFGIRVVATLAIACMLGACGHDQQTVEQPRAALTMTVGLSQDGSNATYVGTISARNVSNQGFRVSGTVLKRLVEVGQHVTAGTPLLQLDPSNLELNLTQAKAQLDAARSKAAQARVNLERDAELLKQNFISQAQYDHDKVDLDTANAQFQAAQAQYGEATNQADYGTLRAAVDGVVTALDVDVGQVVNPGKTAVSIARDGDREVVVSVPESRLEQLRAAKTLTVTLWALPGKTWQARLRAIDPAASKTTGTYDAHVTVLQPDASMLLGMTAYVHIAGATAAPVFVVPMTALVYPKQVPAVWIVDTDDTVATHPVTLQSIRGDKAYITAGLHNGDVIVTAGVNLLHAGEKVKPVAATPATGQ